MKYSNQLPEDDGGFKIEYPYLRLDERIGNLRLRLMGVAHTPEFFEEHQDLFQDEVNKTNHIFFEDGPIFDSDIAFAKFFRGIAGQVREKNNRTPIYVPDISLPKSIDLFEWAQLGTGLSLIAAGTSMPFKNLIEKKNYSRRDLLKMGAHLSSGFFLLSSYYGGKERKLYSRDFREESYLDDLLAYSTVTDYRNLVTATNLDFISNYLNLKGNATLFMGGAHISGISAYLNKPTLRAKRFAYLPQDLVFGRKVKEFRYSQDADKWKQTRTIHSRAV